MRPGGLSGADAVGIFFERVEVDMSHMLPSHLPAELVIFMFYLYGIKGAETKLVATFSSEEQALAYVRWATLGPQGSELRFEQGSALSGFHRYHLSDKTLTPTAETDVNHNPSPSML